MLKIKIEKSFKKDIARDKKSGLYSKIDFLLLKNIIDMLQEEQEIDLIYKRHPLKGSLKDYESLHIKNDWLLIFKIDEKYVTLVMIGKHTQVYKKFK